MAKSVKRSVQIGIDKLWCVNNYLHLKRRLTLIHVSLKDQNSICIFSQTCVQRPA